MMRSGRVTSSVRHRDGATRHVSARGLLPPSRGPPLLAASEGVRCCRPASTNARDTSAHVIGMPRPGEGRHSAIPLRRPKAIPESEITITGLKNVFLAPTCQHRLPEAADARDDGTSWNLAEQLHEYRALSSPDGGVVTAPMLVPTRRGTSTPRSPPRGVRALATQFRCSHISPHHLRRGRISHSLSRTAARGTRRTPARLLASSQNAHPPSWL
jgi:hypothetical protein